MDDVQHFDEVLFAFVLGCLSPAETTGVQVHLKTCRRCTQALAQVRDDTAQLALALPPLPAPALIRESLMHSIGEINRFFDWAEPLSTYAGCSPQTAHLWLDGLDDANLWEEGADFGVRILRAPKPCVGSFVRLQAGTQVPHDEGTAPSLFVLQGTAHDSNGTTHRAGDVLQLQGDEHAEIFAAPGPDLIYLSMLSHGSAQAHALRPAQCSQRASIALVHQRGIGRGTRKSEG